MNSKTAKKLRKIAMGMVVAAEEKKGTSIEKVAYVQDTKGTVTVAKNSWKGAYKALKNGLRKNSAGIAFNGALKTTGARKQAVQTV